LTAITKASCGLEKRPACEKSSCSLMDQKPEKTGVGESKMQIASLSLIEPGLFWAALKGLPG